MPKSRRAFLVEDNPDVRASLIEALHELASVKVAGYADNESEAIDWLAVYSDDIDFVILDMHLPSGSGLSILKQMRDAKLTHPMIVWTGNSSPDIRERCIRAGATVFFDKATEQDSFFDYVRGSVLK